MPAREVAERIARAKPTYNYCGICGRVPKTSKDEPNLAPVRWWDPDDGWKIGSLCRWCAEENLDVKPKPEDFAFDRTNHVADQTDTDEDPIEALDPDMRA